MPLKKILMKNAAWLFAGEISDKILSYFLIVVLARSLGDVGLGEYSFVFAFAGMMFILSDLGIGYYLIREIARSPRRAQVLFSNSLTLKAGLITTTFLIMLGFLTILPKQNHVLASIVILSIIFSFQNIGNLFESVFQSKNKMHYVALARILERVVAFSLGLYILLKYESVLLFFIVLLIAYFVKFIYEYLSSRRFVKFRFGFNKKILFEIFKAGIPLWLMGVFIFIYFRVDIIMLSLIVGDQVVGWYSAAYKLIDALNFIPYIIVVATFPSMSLLFKQNKKLLKILLSRVVRYLIFIAIPLIIGTIMLADRILQFIYGDLFVNSTIALQILIVAQALAFITYILGTALNAMNKEKLFTLTLASLSVFNIGLNFVLIPKYSYIGAAVATVFTEILSLIILHKIIKKTLFRIKYYVIQPLIAASIMGVVLYVFRSLAFWWLIAVGIIVYFGALCILGLKKEDKLLISQTWQKIQSLRAAK